MRYEVTLPRLGDDEEEEEEATVSYWLADEGDTVTEGNDLVDMTTDKAAFTLPSPATGTLVEKLVEEGQEVQVGDVICILEVPESAI